MVYKDVRTYISPAGAKCRDGRGSSEKVSQSAFFGVTYITMNDSRYLAKQLAVTSGCMKE
jgi:hypothetical protein